LAWADIFEDVDGEVFITDPDTLDALKISPEVGVFMWRRGMGVPMCPPSIKTPEPRDEPGAVFDEVRVDRILSAFHNLQHVTGAMAGRPLDPDPWQVAHLLAPVFGWVHWDDDAEAYVRIITKTLVDVPRKNGKTTIAGGVGIYMTAADGEPGAQVLACATTTDQAGFCFAPIRTLAKGAPALKGHVKAYQSVINHESSGSYFKPIANVGDAQHGANVHCAIVDELHLHKTPELVEAIETGTGSRTQPLILYITTADTSRRDTVYHTKRTKVESLASGALKDPSFYGVVWAADREDDPMSETTWAKANPGYGVSPTRRFMREQATDAQQSPANLASFQRLHLGIRTKQVTKYLTMESWTANAGIIDESTLKGRKAFGALDLATTSDVTALAWVMPRHKREGYDVVWRMWVPEDSLPDLDKRTANNASVWKRNGWLKTTPGNVTDYDYIKAEIQRDVKFFDVQSVAYDRWNSSQLVNDLTEDGVCEMVSFAQSYIGMNAPTQELQRLLLRGQKMHKPLFVHGGNPVMYWMVDNFAVAMDPQGNVKPDKANSGEKIDGVVAGIMALAGAMEAAQAAPKSIYDDEDVEFG
jgi:phage terminase large subunit-like protein